MSDYREVNALLSGGGGGPSLSFPKVGTTYEGRIIDAKVEQKRDIVTGQHKTWPDGNPMMQVVLTLQTDLRDPELDDDSGVRRLYVGSYGMKQAFQKALKEAGVDGIGAGGTVKIRYSGDGTPTSSGMNPPKEYIVRYTPAVVGFDDDFSAPQQYAEDDDSRPF